MQGDRDLEESLCDSGAVKDAEIKEERFYHRIEALLFLLYRKMRPIKQKPSGQDAHKLGWRMYCVPNLARQSVQAH